MTQCNRICRTPCQLAAVIAGLIIGVITVTVPFLLVAFGIGVVYLLALLPTVALMDRTERSYCRCDNLRVVLAGILGTILFAVILLAVGITATSVISAILAGLLAAFVTLIFVGTACLVRCIAGCER